MPLQRLPPWIRVRPPEGDNYEKIKSLLGLYGLVTVCEEAHCPNIGECWTGGTATFMILGDTCTRACRFCNVKSGDPRGWVDPLEPIKVAKAVAHLGLIYIVITSVDRDDLLDGGAAHFAATVRALKHMNPDLIVETLIPDFQGVLDDVRKVVEAEPDVISQNIETVERLTHKARDRRAGYRQTLDVLSAVKSMNSSIYTKSSLIIGFGETEEEVLRTLQDLREADVDIVTMGQYLRPSNWHLPVAEYLPPERFEYYKDKAERMGFLYVASGPLVRTSYRAGEYFLEKVISERRTRAEFPCRSTY